jgi:hypothetical protein
VGLVRGREEGGGREFRGREEVKKKISTGREDVHPQNRLNRLILNWCIGGCWFTPAPLIPESLTVITSIPSDYATFLQQVFIFFIFFS